ncbi:MAG TPA: DUF4142 domain-containing protein [Pirellulales bacterium]|nr:DUF4142 domain-containing protein [Pirellulales bacterium]
MGKSMLRIVTGAALLAACLAADTAFGQRRDARDGVQGRTNQPTGAAGEESQFDRRQAGYRGQSSARPSLTDWQIGEWLMVDNQAEIALSEAAEKSASDDDVKEFAQDMRDKHHEVLQKLRKEVAMQPRGGQPGGARPRGVPVRPGARQGMDGLDLVSLKQQLGEQCRKSALQELQQKHGAEFDKCYMGMQIGMHMQMLDSLKVFSRYASPELDRLIEEGENSTQSHLERAKHIVASLEGRNESGARSARRKSRDQDDSESSK